MTNNINFGDNFRNNKLRRYRGSDYDSKSSDNEMTARAMRAISYDATEFRRRRYERSVAETLRLSTKLMIVG